jgi:hypothetical protein
MSAASQPIVPWSREFTTVVIEQGETSGAYGCKPQERAIEQYVLNGVINLDKPAGPTSHEVVAWLKKMLDIALAGHSGTLDETGRSWRDRRVTRLHR